MPVDTNVLRGVILAVTLLAYLIGSITMARFGGRLHHFTIGYWAAVIAGIIALPIIVGIVGSL